MEKRLKTKAACMLLLLKIKDGKQQILLQKRQNTGYMDGFYDVGASGHLEENESIKQATIREAKEEINIIIDEKDLHLSSVVHKNMNNPYFNFYFYTYKYENEPIINEPDKCSEIIWVDVDNLPSNLIEDRKIAIANHLNQVNYCDLGF